MRTWANILFLRIQSLFVLNDGLVIIPTYNEIENIEAMVRTVFDIPRNYHLLVVDDNSPDGTAQNVRELMEEFPDRLFLAERRGKLGLGTAYIHGFKWALERDYAYIFEMDADFSHKPGDLVRLHRACIDGADVAVGSRYKKGVNVVNWPLSRILISYGASFYVRLLTGMPVHDPTSGFVCYTREALSQINLDGIRFIGYAFQIEMKYRAYLRKLRIQEVSIIFTDRVNGKSKMDNAIILEGVIGVIKMRLNSLFRKSAFLNG